MKMKSRYKQWLAMLAAYSLSTYAHADTATGFMDKLTELICALFGENGKIVGIVVVLAIILFGLAITFSEEKGSAVTMGLKVGLGISVVVGAISLAQWFGVGFDCGSIGTVSFQL